MTFVIHPFDTENATEQDWEPLHEFRRKMYALILPGTPVPPNEYFEADFKEVQFDNYSFIATQSDDPSTIIGFASCSIIKKDAPSYEQNKDTLKVTFLIVLDDYRRRGLGTALLREIYEIGKRNELTYIRGPVWDEAGFAFSTAIGAPPKLESEDARLVLSEVDWAMVETWMNDGLRKSPNTILEFYEYIPEILLEEYVRLYNDAYNNMARIDPSDTKYIFTPDVFLANENKFRDAGLEPIHLIMRESDGTISGFAEIFIFRYPDAPPLAYQFLTAVQDEYRGSGRGKWLKSAMLSKVRTSYPDVQEFRLQTLTSDPVLIGINQKLGYKTLMKFYYSRMELDKVSVILSEKV